MIIRENNLYLKLNEPRNSLEVENLVFKVKHASEMQDFFIGDIRKRENKVKVLVNMQMFLYFLYKFSFLFGY